jgi:hypothetical protein
LESIRTAEEERLTVKLSSLVRNSLPEHTEQAIFIG